MERRDCAEKIRVLIVDDHPLVRKGIGHLIALESDMEVCGESETAPDALAKVVALLPNVVTVDLNIGNENGLDLIGRMQALDPALKIIVLSMHEERWFAASAAAAGAHGYVTKLAAGKTLVSSIRRLMHSRIHGRRPEESVPSHASAAQPPATRNPMPKIVSQLRTAAAVMVMCGVSVAQSATLTSVPMQGGMVMPMFTYHAEHGELHVMMPAEVPQLTPLMVSNPADNFDLADPWYDALDPSREGRAFSRRYGFVMDTMTDPLPQETGIVIRKLSGSPEIGFYRAHAMSLPHLWQPLFGTEGTTNTFAWSGSMFHPCVTAPPGTNACSATFEAFLVNTNTGVAVPDSGTGTFVLNWTSLPDGRPTVGIAARMVIAWPADAVNWALESADSVPSANWTAVTNSPVMVDGQPCVILDGSTGNRFYRMRRLP